MQYLNVLFFLWSTLFISSIASSKLVNLDHGIVSCSNDAKHIIDTYKLSNTQKTIAIQWSHSHQIRDFTMTDWVLVPDITKIRDLDRFNIKNKNNDPVFVADITYYTNIHLPAVLKKILNLDIEFQIMKKIYMIGQNAHVIANIYNIPIIDHAEIYSRVTFYSSGRVLAKSLVNYGEIPFYIKWAQSSVEQSLRDSLTRTIDVTCSSVCL